MSAAGEMATRNDQISEARALSAEDCLGCALNRLVLHLTQRVALPEARVALLIRDALAVANPDCIYSAPDDSCCTLDA